MRLKIALSFAALLPTAALAQTSSGSISYLAYTPPCQYSTSYSGASIAGSTTCGSGPNYATGMIAANGGNIVTAASAFGEVQQQARALVQSTSYVTISDPSSIFRVEVRSRNLQLTTTLSGAYGQSSAFVEYWVKGLQVSGLTPVAQFAFSDRKQFNGAYGQEFQGYDACWICPSAPASGELFLSFSAGELSPNGIFMLALQGYADATIYGDAYRSGATGEARGSMEGYDVRLYSRDAYGVQHDVTDEHTITFNPANPEILPVTATPEPATLGLMATGLIAMFAVRRKRKAA